MTVKEGETGRKGTKKLVGDFEGRRSIVGGAVNMETLWNWSFGIGFHGLARR